MFGFRRGKQVGQRGFLSRLARDTRGNVLAITAATVLPLLCMIGSGIDLSRAYMAHARLQQACDAAALAGRRAMTDGVVDGTVRDEANKFFNFNYVQGAFGTAAFTPSVTGAANSTVVVTASTTIPTTVMKIFGYVTLPLDVTCNAKLDFVNTDIVLVLDTTGSMDDSVSGEKKIISLRKAVMALYDELKPVQDTLAANGLRLRYGIVPYSSGVNVGKLIRAVSPSYVVSDNWTYQSRQAAFKHVQTGVTQSTCSGYSYNSWERTSGSGSSATGTCTWYNTSNSGGTTTFYSFFYVPTSYDVSGYVRGDTVTTLTGANGSAVNSTWAGCIEERDTTTAITGTYGYNLPAAAKDLDIDLIPADNTSRWRPYWPEVAYRPDGNKPQVACPTEAVRLKTWDSRGDLNSYLARLEPTGGTYHDNGMIWGARFIAPTGIFGSDNPSTYAGMPVSRHVIFMTDGIIDTGDTIYHTYGIERWDKRVTGGWSSETDSNNRHDMRFKMMCNETKGMGVSIWVVAFASTLSSSLSECASNSNQASTSADSDALIAKFVEIGKNIGALRLTK